MVSGEIGIGRPKKCCYGNRWEWNGNDFMGMGEGMRTAQVIPAHLYVQRNPYRSLVRDTIEFVNNSAVLS